jgi:hypothetical protein
MADSQDSINLTPPEMAKLSGWSLTTSYTDTELHQMLLELAIAAYRSTCIMVRPKKPTRVQCYDQYWVGLTIAKFYCKDIAEKKIKKSELHEQGAQLLAKYVLHKDWEPVSKTRCP